jgi:Xaa-Pro aminopeptidase
LGVNRLQKLRSKIAEKGLDALLVSQSDNYRYLSGFTGEGHLFISDKHAILATDFRYVEQAKNETQDFEIIQIKGDLSHWFPELVSNFGWQKLGFEANYISFASYHHFSETIKTKQLNLELIPTMDLVEHLRSIKEPEELEHITKAVELTDAAFEQVKTIIHPGITEGELAWEIEKFLRQNGSGGLAFDIIVASGPNSALPHAKPTVRRIQSGEPVLIDMGARVDGYCSDFTRTFCLEKKLSAISYQLSAIYNIVLQAQLTAIEGVKAGMSAAQTDGLARSVIEQAGYGDNFGHSLGHGVGIAVHELPTIASNSPDLLVNGMVFTIEPGIYLPGWGGVRIEDMVTLERGKARVLTKSEKKEVIL